MTPPSASAQASQSLTSALALRFVLLLGGVSLLADMTYEGARSINGPFPALLGASGLTVGVVSGVGEPVGYGLRLVSGYLGQRTRRYWPITLIGYALNLLSVPLLALSGHWGVAALLRISERIGKGIRVPPRDTMLSFATQPMGHGWGFGLHEALDRIGAILGPLVVAGVLAWQGNYRHGYAILTLPALLALSVLLVARRLYPNPRALETPSPTLRFGGFDRTFWIYVLAAGGIAAGFADFPLIAYHFQKAAVVPATLVPVFYALAMGVDALAASLFGRLFEPPRPGHHGPGGRPHRFLRPAGIFGRHGQRGGGHGAVGGGHGRPGIHPAGRRGRDDGSRTARPDSIPPHLGDQPGRAPDELTTALRHRRNPRAESCRNHDQQREAPPAGPPRGADRGGGHPDVPCARRPGKPGGGGTHRARSARLIRRLPAAPL